MSIATHPAPNLTSDAQELDSILQDLKRSKRDSGPDLQRRFRHCITHDADVVAEAALPLVELIAPMKA
jgi:hypothetical protein